jgi:predicted metal-dependent hydrolase
MKAFVMMDRPLLARAADLFNRKLYFECHDLLEDAWTGERGRERDFLQGLIHLAVGMYHLAADNYEGAVSQLGRGVHQLEPFSPEQDGLDVDALLATTRRCLAKAERALGRTDAIEWHAEDIPRMELAVE